MAKVEIRDCEDAEKQAFEAQQNASRPRKRRRALGEQALTVGEANAKIKRLEGGTQAQKARTTQKTQTRKRPATADSTEELFDESSSEELSDISSCIVCELRK